MQTVNVFPSITRASAVAGVVLAALNGGCGGGGALTDRGGYERYLQQGANASTINACPVFNIATMVQSGTATLHVVFSDGTSRHTFLSFQQGSAAVGREGRLPARFSAVNYRGPTLNSLSPK